MNAPGGIGLMALLVLIGTRCLGLGPQIDRLQNIRDYQLASGAMLSLFIFWQWQLPFERWKNRRQYVPRALQLHKYLGAIAPIFFCLHAQHSGYGIVWILSTAYCANFVLALFQQGSLRIKGKAMTYAWLIIHIVLSIIVTVLSLVHIAIACWFS